ncbi:hypothetical protein BDC45DRAFT_530005 [Circinella umbellata]|nr:hypothetical protein BDC45DRAFT_530005 [Circinella umbellata]
MKCKSSIRSSQFFLKVGVHTVYFPRTCRMVTPLQRRTHRHLNIGNRSLKKSTVLNLDTPPEYVLLKFLKYFTIMMKTVRPIAKEKVARNTFSLITKKFTCLLTRSKVAKAEYLFQGCSKVAKAEYLFQGCSKVAKAEYLFQSFTSVCSKVAKAHTWVCPKVVFHIMIVTREQAACMFFCKEFNDENASKLLRKIEEIGDVDLCYLEDPTEPLVEEHACCLASGQVHSVKIFGTLKQILRLSNLGTTLEQILCLSNLGTNALP